MNPTPNFDPLAKPYRWLEYLTFGPYLQRARTHFLNELTHCRQALVLGDGDGRFTAQLLRVNPQVQIHAVDASPKMLQALQKSAGLNANRISTKAADLRHWQPSPDTRYDLIATHFVLDCLTTEEVASLARRLTPATSPSTQWLVSDFAIPENALGQRTAKSLIRLLYLAFRLLTNLRITHLPNHPQSLTQVGWRLQRQFPHLGGLLVSQLWTIQPRIPGSPGN